MYLRLTFFETMNNGYELLGLDKKYTFVLESYYIVVFCRVTDLTDVKNANKFLVKAVDIYGGYYLNFLSFVLNIFENKFCKEHGFRISIPTLTRKILQVTKKIYTSAASYKKKLNVIFLVTFVIK